MSIGLTATDPLGLLLLGVVGAIASGINAVAGGGSLISFPVLVALRVPELPANATNSVALWPGSLTGAFGFIERIEKTKHHLRTLLPPTVAGSIVGAAILLATPAHVFRVVVPVLILFATLLLLFQPQIRGLKDRHDIHLSPTAGVVCQFFVAVYGGYFGAGMGILMLAYLGLMLPNDIHELNAIKGWLGLVINFVASIIFVAKGLVLLTPCLAMTLGSLIGGYAAARMSLRVDANRLRVAIAILGFVMALWFTWRLVA